jgi:zinc protease
MTASMRPVPGTPRPYAFPAVVRSTLPNGLRIAVAPMPRLPLVTVLALVDVGATQDPAGHEGTAAITAAALREGTARLDGAALTEQFERLGTSFDAGSDWDSTLAHFTVMPSRLEAAMALLGDVLTTPAFAEHDIERIKAERLAELLQQRVEPRGLANDEFARLLYVPESRYGIPAEGDEASVPTVRSSIARAFHRERFLPAATTLILVGDVAPETANRLAERAFGAWTAGAAARALPDDRTVEGGRRVHIVHKADAPQSELRIGHRGIDRMHPDYFPVVVMNALLGGLFSSRINLNLRERNAYTYGAHSTFAWRRGTGPFVVSTAVKTEVTDAATREILTEIARMREETVDAAELSLATDYLDGVFPIRYETTHAVAEAIATADVFGLGIDYFSRYRERVRAVTAADVRRVAEAHLHPGELLVVAVGDAKAIRDPLERMAIGPIQVHLADSTGSALRE